jgi:hypothetical protein
MDFGDFNNLDWFVEGLATYASGQCTDKKMDDIRIAIKSNEIPVSLNDFWKGKMRYGLSGSVVIYIDNYYGRSKLKDLMKLKSKTDLLSSLDISESELLSGWRSYMLK